MYLHLIKTKSVLLHRERACKDNLLLVGQRVPSAFSAFIIIIIFAIFIWHLSRQPSHAIPQNLQAQFMNLLNRNSKENSVET